LSDTPPANSLSRNFLDMASKTITILTSPSTSTKALPSFPHTSPTTGKPIQYRIEERKRTVYVTTDVAPSEWDPESLENIFNLAEGANGGDTSCLNVGDRSQRTRSLVETQFIITEDSSAPNASYEPHTIQASPRESPSRSRRLHKSPGLSSSQSSSPALPTTPRRSPIQARPRILFYHKNDPYYGFTNFSPHPVMYKGKRYPTSEHLFQSFKVRFDEFALFSY